MTDQPTTPTVDTDELRALLAEAYPWLRSINVDGVADRIAAVLARPVPAAPAEPGRVMFDGPDVVGCRACGDPAEVASPDAGPSDADFGEYDCDSCGYQFGSDGAGVCRRCLLPPDAHRGDAHWTALGIDREGEPLAAPAEPGATEGELRALLRRCRALLDPERDLDQLKAEIRAALAASPAPADEGLWQLLEAVADMIDAASFDTCPTCGLNVGSPDGHREGCAYMRVEDLILSGWLGGKRATAAAPPASAVPKERDEAVWQQMLVKAADLLEGQGPVGLYSRRDHAKQIRAFLSGEPS